MDQPVQQLAVLIRQRFRRERGLTLSGRNRVNASPEVMHTLLQIIQVEVVLYIVRVDVAKVPVLILRQKVLYPRNFRLFIRGQKFALGRSHYTPRHDFRVTSEVEQ